MSFDIDGTMVFGEPPGVITVDTVVDLQVHGAVIGSASDRTMSNQTELWRLHDVAVDFVGHKHRLDQIRMRFAATRWIHIGDTQTDEAYARHHDFEFYYPEQFPKSGLPDQSL